MCGSVIVTGQRSPKSHQERTGSSKSGPKPSRQSRHRLSLVAKQLERKCLSTASLAAGEATPLASWIILGPQAPNCWL